MMKHNYLPIFFLPIFFFLSLGLSAQTPVEDCTNGIDDDGDGLIDCYDPDCTCMGQCADFYYTTCNAPCTYVPPCAQLSLGVQWVGEAETGTYSTLVAGDMDGDGIPEVVTYWVEHPDIYVIDGATGVTKVHIVGPTLLPGGTAPAIADLDHDGLGEIVIVGQDRYLRCYENDGTLKYTSSNQVGYSLRYRFSVPNIADFDHNGWPEVNIGNEVYNGQTGQLLAGANQFYPAGEHPKRKNNGYSFASPVAIDALPDNFCPDCSGLEIVAGNSVFSVNLVTGAMTEVVTIPPPYTDGFTSVADFDLDGDLDAIVQGEKNGFNTLYVWDIQTPVILREYQLPENIPAGASRVNVADLDGDGQLEVSFVEYPRLIALDNDFTPMWMLSTTDASSITCSSVFDFCGDGTSDVIYRGEDKLQVIEGATGQIKWEDVCRSATHIENPLVLDVDGDGQTEIVIECGSNGGSVTGNVVAYEAMGSPGIASRRVWNQHAYFNTNINDDLSVPRYQQNPSLVGDGLVINTFMNQYFNPSFPVPDAALSLVGVQCVGDSLDVQFSICNNGDNLLPALMPVSFYKGNPLNSAAQWVGLLPLGLNLAPDSCQTVSIRIPRVANDSVFVLLNDDHSLLPPFSLSQDFPVTTIGECDFSNNIASFSFDYMPGMPNLGQDTVLCGDATIDLDGAANQLFNYVWSEGSMVPQLFGVGPGVYSVSATDVCGILHTDSIVVEVDTSTLVRLGADRTLCQGESFNLGENGFEYYNWSPAIAVNCTNCPGVTVTPVLGPGFVRLEAGFANGCKSVDTVFTTVHPVFDYTVDTAICYGTYLNWSGAVLPPDSLHIFALQTIFGCDSTVRINVMHKDTFATFENIVICNGETANVFGAQLATSGNYRMVFNALNGCDSSHTISLTVLEPIDIAIDATSSCFGEATGVVTTAVSGGAPPFSYAWNGPYGNIPELDGVPAGNYLLTVTDDNNCTETAQAQVGSYPPLVFSIGIDSVRCFGDLNGAIHISSVDPMLMYSLENGSFIQTDVFADLGADVYQLIAQDINGCQDTVLADVYGPPLLQVALPGDTMITLGEKILLDVVHSAPGLVNFSWSDTSYLQCLQCTLQTIQPFQSVVYGITVTDAKGCSATDQMSVQVERVVEAFLPNVFSLNAVNDYNRSFRPGFGPSVSKINLLQIYDRWGGLLHEVRNVLPDDAALIWDGHSKGALMPPGVYIWVVELDMIDGTAEKIQGSVTLLR